MGVVPSLSSQVYSLYVLDSPDDDLDFSLGHGSDHPTHTSTLRYLISSAWNPLKDPRQW